MGDECLNALRHAQAGIKFRNGGLQFALRILAAERRIRAKKPNKIWRFNDVADPVSSPEPEHIFYTTNRKLWSQLNSLKSRTVAPVKRLEERNFQAFSAHGSPEYCVYLLACHSWREIRPNQVFHLHLSLNTNRINWNLIAPSLEAFSEDRTADHNQLQVDLKAIIY
jgi:hypothetical protein